MAKGFQIYTDAGAGWRWRLVHPNGNIVADSAEAYASKQKALQGARSVKGLAATSAVRDENGAILVPAAGGKKRKVAAKKPAAKKAAKKPAKKKGK